MDTTKASVQAEPDLRTNAGLDATSSFWCEFCNKIQPTFFEGAYSTDISGKFFGGDVVCKECGFVIATAYQKRCAFD